MRLSPNSRRSVRLSFWFGRLAVAAVLLASAQPRAWSQAAERPEIITVFETNAVPRYITNVIKVAIPTNYFYTEFRTNWFRDRRTNVIQVTHTNVLTDYRTNIDYVIQYVTNFTTRYQTNVETITVTNWETVNLRITNSTTRVNTNTVETPPPSVTEKGTTQASAAPAILTNASLATSSSAADQPIEFELVQRENPAKPGQFSVTIALRETGATSNSIPVAEWRVERADRAALMLGSRAEFTGTLMTGAHQVTARYKDVAGVLRSVRAELTVGASGNTLRVPARSKSAAP